jgi:hypothetical protein
VPTCGLQLNVETFTLAPALINEAQPQVNGVSPGHSGVSGFSVTLMSRSVGSLPFTRSRSEKFRYGYDGFFPTSVFAVSTI